MCHPAQQPDEVLLRDCVVRRTRRSGPGGQHRNKVETAVVVEHQPTGLRGEASERRSQSENRQVAICRLRIRLALHVRCEPAKSPSPLWIERMLQGKVSVSPLHRHFPALLAEAMDVVCAFGGDSARAAQYFRLTHSQFLKLLKLEPEAFRRVNQLRTDQGLGRLR